MWLIKNQYLIYWRLFISIEKNIFNINFLKSLTDWKSRSICRKFASLAVLNLPSWSKRKKDNVSRQQLVEVEIKNRFENKWLQFCVSNICCHFDLRHCNSTSAASVSLDWFIWRRKSKDVRGKLAVVRKSFLSSLLKTKWI